MRALGITYERSELRVLVYITSSTQKVRHGDLRSGMMIHEFCVAKGLLPGLNPWPWGLEQCVLPLGQTSDQLQSLTIFDKKWSRIWNIEMWKFEFCHWFQFDFKISKARIKTYTTFWYAHDFESLKLIKIEWKKSDFVCLHKMSTVGRSVGRLVDIWLT